MDNGSGKRLKGRERLAICEYLAMGFTPGIAAQELKNEFGVICSKNNIIKNYLHNKKHRKTIEHIRKRRVFKATKHPLFDSTARLNILLRAINYAFKESTDKLYFDKEGNLCGKLLKVNFSSIAPLIKEAREEIAFLTGKSAQSPEVKISLLQIIKDVTEKENGVDNRTKTKLGEYSQGTADRVDQSRIGNIEIL